MSDSGRTEDVEEADVPTWCPKCGRRAGTCTCDPFKRLRKTIRDLRSRLEEARKAHVQATKAENAARRRSEELEEELHRVRSLLDDVRENYQTALRRSMRRGEQRERFRHRAEQFEGVVRKARDQISRELDNAPGFPDAVREWLTRLRERLDAALDSREDEGSGMLCGNCGSPDVSIYWEPEAFCSTECRDEHEERGCPLESDGGFREKPGPEPREVVDGENHRRCYECGKIKPQSEFGALAGRKAGVCLDCGGEWGHDDDAPVHADEPVSREGEERLYVIVKGSGPDVQFVVIENHVGKSVSVPRRPAEGDEYSRIGPLYRRPATHADARSSDEGSDGYHSLRHAVEVIVDSADLRPDMDSATMVAVSRSAVKAARRRLSDARSGEESSQRAQNYYRVIQQVADDFGESAYDPALKRAHLRKAITYIESQPATDSESLMFRRALGDLAVLVSRRLSDAPSGETVMVAICENDDCDDDSRFPLEDGDSMEPARCSFCGEPYTIRHAPSGEGERDE